MRRQTVRNGFILFVHHSTRRNLTRFFCSNDIKLHQGKTDDGEFLRKHIGGLLTPPLPLPESDVNREDYYSTFLPAQQRTHLFSVECNGWKEASGDIAIRGLGWISITGAGVANLEVSECQRW